MYKCVIFDLYGTLLQTQKNNKVYLQFLKKIGICDISKAIKIILTENHDSFESISVRLEKTGFSNLGFYEQLLQQEVESVVLYPEILETLQKIKDMGIQIAVISNLATPYCKPFYKYELNLLVDYFVFSCCVGYIKPEAEIYKIVCDKWNLLPRDILMVGDSYRCDVLGAKSVGFDAVLLDRERTCKFPGAIFNLKELLLLL